jgi:hypothetical protein
MTAKPKVDPKKIDAIYEEVVNLQVSLDSDPLAYGPKRLNNKVALARTMLSRCERLFMTTAQDLHWFKRQHRSETALYDVQMTELLANDPEVRAGPSVSSREAIAKTKLKEDVESLQELDSSIQELEAVLTVIKAKRSDLKDIQGRLRDQLKICQEEIGLGGRWGSKNPDAEDLSVGIGQTVAKDGYDVVDDLLLKVDSESHLKEAKEDPVNITDVIESSPEEILEETSSSDEVDDFLANLDVDTGAKMASAQSTEAVSMSSVDSDLDSFLDNLD